MTTVFPSADIGRVVNFYVVIISIETLIKSKAQIFPAVEGKFKAVRIDALFDPGSYFMQQPLVYPAMLVQSASFVQVAGTVGFDIPKLKITNIKTKRFTYKLYKKSLKSVVLN